MFSRRLKIGYLTLEGLNSLATVYYFYYFYFYMQKAYGFDNRANLALAALNGGTYAVCAWGGGKFAQRFGYFTALKLGFGIMLGALAVGTRLPSAGGQIVIMVLTVVGMCFTWPTLEALISEGESRAGLQHMVGVYNVVWAGTAAVAYFLGGAMLDRLGLRSLFYVPMAIQLGQLALTFWLEAQVKPVRAARPADTPRVAGGPSAFASQAHIGQEQTPAFSAPAPSSLETSLPAAARAKGFVRMAWLANPFAYIAIQTLIAGVPSVAQRLGLSTTLAGFYCSVWCFARLGAFFGLWFWVGWHYRFRWLLLAYVALVGTFAAILLAPNLAVLILAQLFFGGAAGLIYYSSLFYSMDLSETKGEHGGIHEAAIGLGNCAGPAVGSAALYFLPQYANSGALAVSLLLLGGLCGLMTLWKTGRKNALAETVMVKKVAIPPENL